MKEELQSSYNEGMLQIQRLHYLWIDANNKSRHGDLEGWRWTLETIWRELSRDSYKKEATNIEDFSNAYQLNPRFNQYRGLIKTYRDALLTKNKEVMMEALGNIDIFLRVLQDDVGKGTKYRDLSQDEMVD